MARTAADTEMPFLDHLEELRHRLFWIVGAIVVGVVLSFVVLSRGGFDVVAILARPIEPYLRGRQLVFTHPGTSFSIVLNASLILGILFATPVIGYQLWGFFAPALHPHERQLQALPAAERQLGEPAVRALLRARPERRWARMASASMLACATGGSPTTSLNGY